MKSIRESIIGKKGSHGSHRLTWDMNKSMYTDPEDIIAMLLSGRYIVQNNEGEYRISKNSNPSYAEIKDLGFNGSYYKQTIPVPIDTFAFEEEAIPQLEKERYKIIRQPITHIWDWRVIFIDK